MDSYTSPSETVGSRIARFIRLVGKTRLWPTLRPKWFTTAVASKIRPRSVLAREIDALKAVIGEMRVELHGAQAREERAHYLALHDDLTRLPNRRHFMECLNAALIKQREAPSHLAVIFLDLDNFKTLNDAHGHDAGDQVLKIVAQRLLQAIPAEGFVSRWGGDEYACLVTSAPNANDVRRVVSSLQSAACTSLLVGSEIVSIRPSIGVSIFPSDGGTAASLMKAADVAMFAAKRQRTGIAFHVN